MKKLEIKPSALKIRRAQLPAVSEIKAVKLTYAQAMAFANIRSFDELITRYGSANQLKAGEIYKGYIAVFYPWGHSDVVYFNGYLQKLSPQEANGCVDYQYAQTIREGRAWVVLYQTSDGHICSGEFFYVWTFRDCRFAEEITRLQREKNLLTAINAEETDKALKDKLVNALLSDTKIVEVSDNEDFVLKYYLGVNSYYKAFFTEVQ